MSLSLSDLRRLYYGGGTDAEYAFLLDAYANGISAADLLDGTAFLGGGVIAPYGADPYEGGWSVINRKANLVNANFVSGFLHLTYTTCPRTSEIATVVNYCSTTAAGPTPTLIRTGIWEIDEAGDGVLVASTPNDTTLFNLNNSRFPKALSVPLSVVKGQSLAVGTLVVTAAAQPSGYVLFSSFALDQEAVRDPSPGAYFTGGGLADLPATFDFEDLTLTGSVFQYALLEA